MENMSIYECSRSCPDNALRTIQAGKLKGKSDINPVWRIKQLTQLFGPCGVGWKLCNVRYWTEPGANGEVSAWCSLELKIKAEGEWSDGIGGVGGSMLINTEKGRLVTNDEAYKMAYTDAVSVCCKMLGFAADVYWESDRTKYTDDQDPPQTENSVFYCDDCTLEIRKIRKKDGSIIQPGAFAAWTTETYGRQLCLDCQRKVAKAAHEQEER